MKKNYILPLCFALLSWVSHGQITLTQSVDNTIVAGSVACSGAGVVSDNVFYRAFDITPYGSEFDVLEVSFAVEAVSSASPNFSVDVIIFSNSGAAFPDGTLTEEARVTVPLDDTATGTMIDVAITANVTGAELIFAVETPDESNGTAPDNTTGFQIGSNDLGQTGPSYLSSVACGIAAPTPTSGIGFPDMHIIMEVRDFSTLSVDEFANNTNNISVSPNPAEDYISINFPQSVSVFSTELFDITGKLVLKSNNIETLNVSELHAGVYILRISTDNGTVSKRIIKR